MKRYQLYLNPQSVKTIDDFQKEVKLSRSHIIRITVDMLARNLANALPRDRQMQGALDPLIGLIKISKKQKTNIAKNVDSIYLSD